MDLRDGTYKTKMKPNNTLQYVYNQSNHPPSIVKNIPESINTRQFNISSNGEIFENAGPPIKVPLTKAVMIISRSTNLHLETNIQANATGRAILLTSIPALRMGVNVCEV